VSVENINVLSKAAGGRRKLRALSIPLQLVRRRYSSRQ
jgi:hypothetical protein